MCVSVCIMGIMCVDHVRVCMGMYGASICESGMQNIAQRSGHQEKQVEVAVFSNRSCEIALFSGAIQS